MMQAFLVVTLAMFLGVVVADKGSVAYTAFTSSPISVPVCLLQRNTSWRQLPPPPLEGSPDVNQHVGSILLEDGDPQIEGGHTDGVPVRLLNAGQVVSHDAVATEPTATVLDDAAGKAINDVGGSAGGDSVAARIEGDSVAARIELHLTSSLNELQVGPEGPITKFVETLQGQIALSLDLPRTRLRFLSIRGEYLATNHSGTKASSSANNSHNASITATVVEGSASSLLLVGSKTRAHQHGSNLHGDPALGNMAPEDSSVTVASLHDTTVSNSALKTIVDLEVVSAGSGPTLSSYVATLKSELVTPGSRLMQGTLGNILKGSLLIVNGDIQVKSSSSRTRGLPAFLATALMGIVAANVG